MKKIVVIGGGGGTSRIAECLRDEKGLEITAIITAFDTGGSTGRLRAEFGVPPLGDARHYLAALAKNRPLAELFGFRFPKESSLKGHALGNLIMLALFLKNGDMPRTVKSARKLLEARGNAMLATHDVAELRAKMASGDIVKGESRIDARDQKKIREVFLSKRVKPNAAALRSIRSADVILIGPGDTYTSVIPNLLVPKIAEAIRKSSALKTFVANADAAVPRERAARDILRYLDMKAFDFVIAPTRGLERYGRVVPVKARRGLHDMRSLRRVICRQAYWPTSRRTSLATRP
ncbi:MAG: YvcK family protein [Patescibacteria group bacterium]|nr:YvcK family protein [Patescibacteria group bacterium]